MIHQHIVADVGANCDNLIEDKAVVPDGECMHLEYVGNWVVLGTDKSKVEQLAQAGVNALRGCGLVVHEVEQASSHIKVLGWEFEDATFKPKPLRVWRVRRAFEHLYCGWVLAPADSLRKLLGTPIFCVWAVVNLTHLFNVVIINHVAFGNR